MNSSLRTKVGSFIPILKSNVKLASIVKLNSFHTLKKRTLQFQTKSLVKEKLITNQLRCVSSSKLAKSNDSNNENISKDEKNKNVLDDDEFRSILSDFAKDFGVGSESEQILDEIKKSIDEQSSEPTPISDNRRKCESRSSEKHFNLVDKKKDFIEFSETDSVVIPSYEEYQNKDDDEETFYHIDQPVTLEYSSEKMKRGIFGVYDIADLVDVLRKENLSEITVISVPKELHYTDYLVIATAKSPRHSKAVCENVLKIYKAKKHVKDPFVVVEGENVHEWKVIDMGNIVLHIFLEETRTLYDIESLWLFDHQFDRGGNMKDDPLFKSIEAQMSFFDNINKIQSGDSVQKEI